MSSMLSHEQIRNLIQMECEQGLLPEEDKNLKAHLDSCSECRAYAQELDRLESILEGTFHDRWDAFSGPVNLPGMLRLTQGRLVSSPSPFQRFRPVAGLTATLALLMAAGLFFIQLYKVPPVEPAGVFASPVEAKLAPTPSQPPTTSYILPPGCILLLYQVNSQDTLESIARRFSTDEQDILAYNQLKTSRLSSGMQIIIPLCETTPTMPASSPTSTLLFSPQADNQAPTPQ